MIKKQKSGAKCGEARAEKLSPTRRKEISMIAVAAKKARASLPKATHAGEMHIGNAVLPCSIVVGEDGIPIRLVSLNGLNTAFTGSSGGSTSSEKGPRFLKTTVIKPFMSDNLITRISNPVEFIPLSRGKSVYGYEATILPEICEVVLDATKDGALKSVTQAKVAETLIRGFARIGIIALVDEATGFQKDRARDALAKILEAYVAKELQPYVKKFPASFYEEMFRLRGLTPLDPKLIKRPPYFGHLTNDIVYHRLAPGVWLELKSLAKKEANKEESKKGLPHLHRFLTPDVGDPRLKELITKVTTIMQLSSNWADFKEKLDKVLPAIGVQTYPEMESDSGVGL